jgi:ketosteroid isomerase-like protein
VALDLGTTHREPGETTARVASPPLTRVPRPRSPEEERASLLEADRSFSAASEARDFAAAFLKHAAPDVRLHEQDHLPFTTPAQVRGAVRRRPATAWTPSAAEVASSGDLGYTYGLRRNGSAETGAYCHVWKKQPDGAWRVVLVVEKPFPPKPGAP